MDRTIRHGKILSTLRDRGTLSTAELRRTLGVTAMTVWRDLETLRELGLLRRVRGGAVSTGRAAGEPEFETKEPAAALIKARIAACAVRAFVRRGHTLALEGGTTVAALVDQLPDRRLSILTNSLPIALRVRSRRPSLPVKIAGGWLSATSGNLIGPEALKFMGRQRTDVCFLSATAFDAAWGPSDPNPLEIEMKRALAHTAKKIVLLIDGTKFGRRSAAITLHPRRLHALVTDQPPPPEIAAVLASHRVRILVAPSPADRPAGRSRG